MCYPMKRTNSQTGKTFLIDRGGGPPPLLFEITARETNWFGDSDWGSVTWEIQNNELLLHTIQSHPEKGSGLGGLLMCLVAREAQKEGCARMQILNAARSEWDFYSLMGCTLDISLLANFKRDEFNRWDWLELVCSCPVVGDTAQVRATSHLNAAKRWGIVG